MKKVLMIFLIFIIGVAVVFTITTLFFNDIFVSLTESNLPLKRDISFEEMTYGKSELGNDLKCYYFYSPNSQKTVLLNFAIHGYEDNYDKDGQVLVDTANSLIEHYKLNLEKLSNTDLIIISCANPDGLYYGNTNNGYGRCNSNGIDLNRDFDAEHKVYTNVRNKTPYAFSAIESRALRDLVTSKKPDIVIDFHGWLNMTIGDASLAKLFSENLNLTHKTEFNSNCNGYFSYWAHLQGSESLLVEFKDENIPFDELVTIIDALL